METTKPTAPEREAAADRTRRASLIILIVVAVFAAAAIAAWAIIDANQADDLTTATEIVDQWHTAWVTNDAEAAAALFTEDGVYVMAGLHRGPDIYSYISRSSGGLTFAERLDDGTHTDTGTFVFATRVEWDGAMYLTDLEIALDGDRASRIDHLTWLDEDG